MNKENNEKKQNNNRQLWMDIAAWTIVVFGLLLVALGIVYGIISMAHEIAEPSTESGGTVGIPTLALSISLFISTLIAFAIIFAAVYFLFWDKIKESLDVRQKNVKANIAIANYKAAQAEKNLQVSEKHISDSEREGKEIVDESKREANTVKKEIVAEAKSQSEGILIQSREQIEREKQQMESQIRQEILETSLLAAEKIIEKELDADTNKKMIEELINSLK